LTFDRLAVLSGFYFDEGFLLSLHTVGLCLSLMHAVRDLANVVRFSFLSLSVSL
jgi:hypothetical protein